MAAINELKDGDKITSNGKYDLDGYFNDGPLDVKRVEEVNLPYAGYAIVFCEYGGREVGFYINGVRKVK